MPKISIPAPFAFSSVRLLENDNSTFVSPESAIIFGGILSASNGPVLDIFSVSDEDTLARFYGDPNDDNYIEWWNIARVWKYRAGLVGGTGYICRVVGTGSFNQALAVTDTKIVGTAELTTQTINNATEAEDPTVVFDTADDASETRIKFFSKYPTAEGYKIALATATDFTTADIITDVSFVDNFDSTPTGTEVAIVVLDSNNNILSTDIVDLTEGNTDDEGNNNFIEVMINETNDYILAYLNTTNTSAPVSFEATAMEKGVVVAPVKADYVEAIELYEDVEEIDINYFIGNNIVVKEINTMIVNRQDSQMLWSNPPNVIVGKNLSTAETDLLDYVNTTENFSSNRASFYGNSIYIFDKYANKNRWIEPTGDLVGLRVLRNLTGNPWNSSSGLNHGQLREVIKLAQNFKFSASNTLAKNKINNIVSKKGKGIYSWGIQNYNTVTSAYKDNTTTGLTVTIWKASKEFLEFYLFSPNDETTRGEITAKMEQFMSSIEANGGVSNTNDLDAFTVICDETNNTGTQIDIGQLILEIRFVPTKAIKEIVVVQTLELTGTDLTTE